MTVKPEEIKKIADLSHLRFDETELAEFAQEFSEIIGYVAQLETVEVEGVEPLYHVSETDETGVTRDDQVLPSLSQEEALSNARQVIDSQFRVPKVIE